MIGRIRQADGGAKGEEKRMAKHVVLVEDEPNLVSGLTDALEHHGYRVSAATDGEAGLEQALSGSHDLILLDLMLPRMDGLEVCEQLRRRGVQTPVIMLASSEQR